MLGLTDKILENKTLMYSAVALAFIVAGLLVLLLARLAFGRRSRLSGAGRARQQRLGLVDAFNLDRQRQLIIVRRDNVEHLLMVGGPNDVLIESQIVRAEPARELSRARDKEPDLRPALPVGFGAEPAAVAIVPPAAVSIVPAANAPFVAPSPVPPHVSGDLPPLAASEPAAAVPPISVDARPRAPQPGPRPVSPPPTLSRAPLFPLPPRRPLPQFAKPPVPNENRIEPEPTPGQMPQQGGGLDAPAPGPTPRPGQLPPRAPSFLRPPPMMRPASRLVEPTNEAPPVKDEEPHVGDSGAPAVSVAPPPAAVTPPPLVAPETPAAPAPLETVDPFDSIEEEMAKLLGRSSDKS